MKPTAISLRTKKLGVLIRDARLASNKSVAECAQAIGVSPEEFAAYELGEKAPSLPEVELLAYYLNVPLDHFWGNTSLAEKGAASSFLDTQKLLEIRQRMIGALLRQAREEAGLSLEDVAGQIGFTPAELEACELGQRPLSLPVLETLSKLLRKTVRDFQDKHGPVGVWAAQQRDIADFLKLSPELQSFVARPINRPYLELAQRLSEMSVEKLRAVGEGILEITL